MSQTRTASATYTVVDVENVVRQDKGGSGYDRRQHRGVDPV